MLRRIVAAAAVAVTIVVGASAGNAAPPQAVPAADLPGVPSDAQPPVIQANPASLTFGMDGSLVVKDLQWGTATESQANATGTVEVNTCIPNCAAGKYASQQADLVFRVVTDGDQPYFNCVRIDLPDGVVEQQFNAAHLNLPLSQAAYSGSVDCGPASEEN